MTSSLTRRVVLGGLVASTGSVAFARAPDTSIRPRPRGSIDAVPAAPKKLSSRADELIRKANLGGDVGYAVADSLSGEVLEARMGQTFLPPASTLKSVTALYALDRLGAAYTFKTRAIATGPLRAGRIEGDLILAGGGDPTLDTDKLADLATLLREAGVSEVTGDFKVYAGALPTGDRIDLDQPDHVAYNPSYGGLNLNFNRVHFEWKRNQDDYEVTLQARALRFRPSTNVASMSIVDRRAPIFDHWSSGARDNWSVARRALGKEGARWLPVRFPALYAADVFRTLARSNGIVLKPAEFSEVVPTGSVLAEVESDALQPILGGMMRYSTNLTAEVAGLSASAMSGGATSLASSARLMAEYAGSLGAGRVAFRDHSGLNYDSSITPEDMVRILAANTAVRPMMKTVNLSLGRALPAPKDTVVHAKTGTLNFVSSLAGYVATPRRSLTFAFFSADTARRDAIPPAERERPPGTRAWSRRSRQLQKELIRDWAQRYA
ncbi:MAG: D-alanyl-D-alanine carboxypeptidase/D-alanyl-D-alanine-endopeptidase [Pseudomonadota bacterium]